MNGTLDLGALGNGHRDAWYKVKNRQVDLHLRSEGLEWMGRLAELLFKMSRNLREHLYDIFMPFFSHVTSLFSHLARLNSLAWMATSSNVLTSASRWQGRSNMIKPCQRCPRGAPTPSRVCRIHTAQQPSNLGKAQRHLLLLPP